MSRSAQSVFVFGLYLAAVSLALILFPNPLFAVLRLPASHEVWPRVVGVLALVLAHYYTQAARHEVVAFFRWTISARLMVFVVFGLFVFFGLAPLPLALLGTVDRRGRPLDGLGAAPVAGQLSPPQAWRRRVQKNGVDRSTPFAGN